MKKNINALFFLLLVVAALLIVINPKDKSENSQKIVTPEEHSPFKGKLSNEEIKTQVEDIFDVLMRIHYVSLAEERPENPESIILNELQEVMSDLNSLKGILHKTEVSSKSQNELLATIGLVLKVSTLDLINTHTAWITYLRTVDLNNINLPEFQYQLVFFHTSSHDVYLKLVENSSLLPMVAVNFSEEGGDKNIVNEDVKNHFLAKIDEKFSDILAENEKFYKKTKNRYAIAILVQGYKDFFNEKN